MLNTIIEALFDERARGLTVIEVHISPRIELEIRLSEPVTTVHPILPEGVLGRAVAADWFVDHALTGEQYRFVTAPAADPPAGA